MKKLFIIGLLMMLSFSAKAAPVLKYESVCIAGHVFAVVVARLSFLEPVGVSMVQVFEEISDANSNRQKPMRCGQENKK